MEDPISQEAHRIEVEQTEVQIHQMIYSGVHKFVKSPIIQVQRDEASLGYLISASIITPGERFRTSHLLIDDLIEQFCTSVKAWQDFIWTIIESLVSELRKLAPKDQFRPERKNGWLEVNSAPRGTITVDPLVSRLGQSLAKNAAQAAEDARLQKVQEDLAIESIKRAMRRS